MACAAPCALDFVFDSRSSPARWSASGQLGSRSETQKTKLHRRPWWILVWTMRRVWRVPHLELWISFSIPGRHRPAGRPAAGWGRDRRLKKPNCTDDLGGSSCGRCVGYGVCRTLRSGFRFRFQVVTGPLVGQRPAGVEIGDSNNQIAQTTLVDSRVDDA